MSDDESPWIDMDGNINEMSPENKSPTTYSRPNTPEIDKLKSLMVSSPSTDRSNRSNRSTKSNKSFYEKLEEYYNLKEQYDQKLRDAHTEWNNARPPMSLEKKKENTFEGHNFQTSWGRVFGGQVLAQSLNAAYQTGPSARFAHSLHGYFILGGNLELPITYEVDINRKGKSFTTRRVVALQ